MHIESDGSSAKIVKKTALCFMGLSHLLYLKEYIKGIIFALVEIIFLAGLPFFVRKLIQLVTLGSPHPELAVKLRDNSIFMLIDGILVLALIAIFIAIYVISVSSAEKSYKRYCTTKSFRSQKATLSDAGNRAFPLLGIAPCFILLLIFVVVPLLFSIAVAFTNYSAPSHIPPNNTVDWVGFENFKELMFSGTSWSKGFVRIALWTLIWAVLSTFTCYFGGLIVAVQLKESRIRFAPVFRFIFILPYAVPSVITMLVWRNLLNGTFGTVNRTLQAIGLLKGTIPWLGNATLAQIMCVVINLWAGFGYFMMLSTGTMTAIPEDMYEAARIDGANKTQIFRKITLPLVMYQTLPLIIMSFAHNVNNFGAIYFLTGGAPAVSDSTTTLAGGTDILVSWIYKLTVTLMKYNYASVIAVIIFIVLAPFAIFNFRNTKAYKEGSV